MMRVFNYNKHSSRIRTVRCSGRRVGGRSPLKGVVCPKRWSAQGGVCPGGMSAQGGVGPGGVCPERCLSRGLSAGGGLSAWEVAAPVHVGIHIPFGQNDRRL